MKYIYKLVLSSLPVVLFFTGCDTNALHELNVNPNTVNQIDMNYFLTSAELGVASDGSSGDNRYIDWRTNIGMCAYAIQQLANAGQGGISPGDKYSDTDPEPSNAAFQHWMQGPGKSTAEIIKETGPGGYAEGHIINTRNAARILRVFTFHRMTDFYGSVPYFEANQGLQGTFFPKYDKQKDIYSDLFKELEEATAGLSASNPDEGFTAADIIYNGDITKWQKWGYSLMLRMAMRISNVDPASAATYVNEAIAGGVFTSNDDNPYVPMATGPSQWVNQNGITRAFLPWDGGQSTILGKTLIDFLKGTDPNTTADDDPRLMIISGGIGLWTLAAGFTPVAGGLDPLNQNGLVNGKDQAMLDAEAGHAVNQDATFSKINPTLLRLDSPYQLMNYAEVEFLEAEAIERGIGTVSGTAADHYNAGVKAAMQMYTPFELADDHSLEVSDAQVNAYLATYPYASRPALQMIGEQMWVSKFMNWWEAWSDWRRTGFPVLTPTNFPGNVTGGKIPTKLRLPASEVSGNPNYKTGATQPDKLDGVVWWDGGPE